MSGVTTIAGSAAALLARLRACRRGSPAVEFALMAPVLIGVLAGITDVGLGFYEYMQVQHAAQAGAQYAATKGFVASGIQSAITGSTDITGITAGTPTQSCGCPGADGITAITCGNNCASTGTVASTYVFVSASGTYTTLLPYPGMPSTLTFNAQAVTRLQ